MDTQLKIRSIVFNSVIEIKYLKALLIKYYIMSSNNSNSWMKLFSTAFISGACASAANFLANVSWKTQHAGELDWRDLALLTSIGATIGVHYAKTGRPWFN